MNAHADAIEPFVEAFERARASGKLDDLRRFAPPADHELHRMVLRELIRVDLEIGWAEGRPNSLDEYRNQYPSLFADPADAREIAFEEYRLRHLAGERPDLADYRTAGIDVSDWPALRSEILQSASSIRSASLNSTQDGSARPSRSPAPHAGLFRAVYMKDSETVQRLAKAFPSWPEVGDVFCGFRLVSELGRGAFGRVFLARQGDLANRPVALKVVCDIRSESQRLAQLQHTNIVPIFSVHSSPPFQAICMPYFGGTTLADVVQELAIPANRPSSGASIATVLRKGKSQSLSEESSQALERLSQLTFVEAVLQIAERLADGLAHAHERGVLHRDIKPANVLLASDGQPMLLDFNLAADARSLEGVRAGGTLPYMAPELLERLRKRESAAADAAADIYALGLVIWELLATRHPFAIPAGSSAEVFAPMIAERQSPPDIRSVVPGVPAGFAAIIARCLAPAAEARYSSARSLQEDLRRQLDDRPLRHTREPSLLERLRKWRRRNPRMVWLMLALVAILPLSGFAIDRHRRWVLADAMQSYSEFRDEKERAWIILNAPHTLPSERIEGLALAARARSRFEGSSGGATLSRLEPAQQAAVQRGLSELLFASAGVAARSPGLLPPLETESLAARARALPALRLIDQYRPIEAAVRAGRYRGAIQLIRDAIAESPSDPALWFLIADCHLQLGELAEASGCLDACLALYPNFHRTHYQRGIVRLEQRKPSAALAEFDAALALDPSFWPAYMQRAVARASLKDLAGAMRDLDRVAELPGAPAQVEFMRARLLNLAGDKEGALRARSAGLARTPIDADDWVVRGLARIDDDPNGALADFEAALRLDPANRAALRNQANVLSESLGQPGAAIAVLDRLIEIAPDSGTDLAGRGVLLARLGRRNEAHRDAAAALQADSRPFTSYQVAGIYALTSRSAPGDALEALRLLTTAFRNGVGLDLVNGDPDLDAIRGRPEFVKIIDAARALRLGQPQSE